MEIVRKLEETPQTAADNAGDSLGKLITEVATGDDSALETLYDQTIGKVYALAFAITKSPEEAEEVACDVYTQVWVKASNFSADRGTGMAWLMTICRSRSLDALRRRKRLTARLLSRDDETLHLTEPALEETGRLEDRERARLVHEAIQALPPKHRAVVILRMIEGYSTEETAEILEIPYGTVLSRLSRAHTKLKTLLTPYIQEHLTET